MVGLVLQNYINYQRDLSESRSRIKNRTHQIKAVLEKTDDPAAIDQTLRPVLNDFAKCGYHAETSIQNMNQLFEDNKVLGPILKAVTLVFGDAVGRTERKHDKLQNELAALGLDDEYRKELEAIKNQKSIKAEPEWQSATVQASVQKPTVAAVSDIEPYDYDTHRNESIERFLNFAHQLGKKDFKTILNQVITKEHQLKRLDRFMERLHPSELINSNDDEKLNEAFIKSIISPTELGNDPGFYLKHEGSGLAVGKKKSWSEGGVIFKGEIAQALQHLPLKDQAAFERKLFAKLDGVKSESEKLRLMDNCMRNAEDLIIGDQTAEILINRLFADEDDFRRINVA